MLKLRDYHVFISHCWEYDADYERLVEWLDEEPRFKWTNLSVQESDAFPEDGVFESRLRKRLGISDIILVIAGMEIPRRYWVKWEIKWARIRSIPIVGVRPNGAQRLPEVVEKAALDVVSWRRKSVVRAIRDYARKRTDPDVA